MFVANLFDFDSQSGRRLCEPTTFEAACAVAEAEAAKAGHTVLEDGSVEGLQLVYSVDVWEGDDHE